MNKRTAWIINNQDRFYHHIDMRLHEYFPPQQYTATKRIFGKEVQYLEYITYQNNQQKIQFQIKMHDGIDFDVNEINAVAILAKDCMIAKKFLFIAMIKQILSIGKRFAFIDYQDRIQSGAIGILNAIDKFDIKEGNFATFAYYHILSEVEKFAKQNADGQAITLPYHLKRFALQLEDNKIACLQYYQREVSDEEFVEYLKDNCMQSRGIDQYAKKFDVTMLQRLQSIVKVLSSDTPLDSQDDASSTIQDTIQDEYDFESAVWKQQSKGILQEVLSELSPIEESIIQLKFSAELTFSQIADELGFATPQSVRSKTQTILKRLATMLENKGYNAEELLT